MRGAQLSRQWLILRQIEASRNGLTATEIAKITGVSLRTAYRDLDDLEVAGFPLYTKKDEKGRRWNFVETYHFDTPQPFSCTELMSLHMSREMLEVFKGTVFFDSLESAFQKIETTIPPQALTYLERVRSTFQVGINPYKVRISPAWARYMGEKTWHQSQQMSKMPDKSLELTFRVAGLNEIKQWVLSLGPEAEVIAPKRLKEMVKQDLRKTLLQYLEAGKASRSGRFRKNATAEAKKRNRLDD